MLLSLLLLSSCGGGGGGQDAGGNDDGGDTGSDPGPQGTYISGVVLDTNAFAEDETEVPVVGVRVRFLGEGTIVETDVNGAFTIDNLAAGSKVIDFDTSQAEPAPSGDSYAGFREQIIIDAGANEIDRPFYLPRLASDSLTSVDPAVDTVVTNSDLGVSLTVVAGSARDQDGEFFTGQLSISDVPNALAPAALPEDLEPGLLFTIQPVGVTFDPPATLSIRNDTDNWPAGSRIHFWSLDPDTGTFGIVGEGEVSANGATIETLSGGVRAADWHTPLPPSVAEGDTPDDNDGNCQGDGCCDKAICGLGSEVELTNGRFRETIRLPAYVSQSKVRTLEFSYSSDRAYPVEVLAIEPVVEAATPVPNEISYQGFIDGVLQDYDPRFDSSALVAGVDQSFRVALPLDATELETGLYVGQARVSSHYDASTVSSRIFQDVMVVNDSASEFGAGWRLLNLHRIYPADSGGVILVDGSGFPRRFVESNGSGSIVTIVATGDGAPQVSALQSLLDEIGVPHQFRSTGSTVVGDTLPVISTEDIQDTSLFLATGTNGVGLFGFGGLTDEIKRNVIDVLESAHDQGVPLLFVGDDMGPVTSQLVESDLVRYERLTGIRRNTEEEPRGGFFGALGFWRLTIPDHPIFNGTFGTLDVDPESPFPDGLGEGSDYSPGIDQQANLGETVLVEEYLDAEAANSVDSEILNDQAVFTHRNETSGADALTVTAELPSSTGVAIPDEVALILKNAVDWLTTSVTEPGQLVSPAGDYSVLSVLEDGRYTRRTKFGDLYTFDSSGYLESHSDRNGNSTRYAYNGDGLLEAVTDPVGRVTALTYSGGLLSSVTDPAGRVTEFSHDADGNLTGITLPDDSSRLFSYDARHLMLSQTDQRGFSTSYQYNDAGQVIGSTQADGSPRTITPAQSVGIADEQPVLVDPATALSGFVDPEGRSASMVTGAFGEPTQVTDAADLLITLARDGNGNAISTALPSGSITDRSFDLRGNLTSQIDRTLGGETAASFNAEFSLLTHLTAADAGMMSIVYDDEGNLTQITTPEGRALSSTHDLNGLVESYTDSLGTTGQLAYDGVGLPVQRTLGSGETQRSEQVSYTAEGYVDLGTDALARLFDFDYDPMGRLTMVTLPDGRELAYGYDAAGHRTSLTPPGRETYSFTVNNVGLLSAEQYPPVTGGGTNQTQYSYNLARQITRIIRPDSIAIDYSYDAAGRLTRVTQPDGIYTVGYGASSGLIESITSPDGITQRNTYDDALLTQVSWEGDVAGAIGYGYDAKGRIDTFTIGGQSIGYNYSQDDEVIRAGEQDYSYDDASGLLTSTSLGAISETYEYNQFGEIVRHAASVDAAIIYEARYSRDELGRLTQVISTIDGVTTTTDYTYDLAGRISTVTEDGTLAASYAYDSNDNRLDHGGTYDAQDRINGQSGISYSYSAQGERIAKSDDGDVTEYQYDANGTLVGATLANSDQIDYLLDGQRRRVAKQVNGVTTDGWLYGADTANIVARLDGTNAVSQRYVYGSRLNVPDYVEAGGDTYKVIADHLGSVRLIVDAATGSVVQRIDYDTWGQVVSDTNPGFQPFAFAGGFYDQDTELTQFGFREYDAVSGHWTSKDPLGFEGSTNNLYSYAAADPVNLIDPQGAQTVLPRQPVAYVQQIKPSTQGGNTRLQIDRGDGLGFQCVEEGAPVYAGDVVRTDGKTLASLRFVMGGRGNLDVHSAAAITGDRGFEVLYSDPARDSSFLGRFRFNARRNAQQSRQLRFRTAGGVMAIRG